MHPQPPTRHLDEALLARARAVAPRLSAQAERAEKDRRQPPESVAALREAGAFKLLVPRALGGSQASLGSYLAVLEELGRADGSAGWCAMIGATSGLLSALLPEEAGREVFGPEDATSCGVFAPMGRAVPVEGGYRVSGRWPFASGCEHSAWRMGGVLLQRDPPDLLPSGAPHVRLVLLRAEQTRVHDTWDTSGLRGTGSHDLEAQEAFVREDLCLSLFEDEPRYEGYGVPFFGALAAGVASVGLGVARAAVEHFTELARSKPTPGSKRTIAHRELVQLTVARAEGALGAGRALLYSAADDAQEEAARQGTTALRTRALLRVAAAQAAQAAARAVDLCYEAAGSTGVYARSPLQRCFRDVHVVTQHLMVGPAAELLAGRVLLGLDADTSTL